MPRIRSVKPEMLSSPDVRKLSNAGKVAFLALITHADDEGRSQGMDAQYLASSFCAPGTSATHVQRQLDLMATLGMAQFYLASTLAEPSANPRPTVALLNWRSHQRIDKPRASRIPEPPPIRGKVAKSRRALPEESASVRTGMEGKGSEGKGIDKAQIGPRSVNGASLSMGITTDVDVVFQTWLESTGKTSRTRLDAKRRRLITAGLTNYELQDLLDAVDGWRFDPWHTQERKNDLELILRDAGHIERFRDYKRNPQLSKISRVEPGAIAERPEYHRAWVDPYAADERGHGRRN